MKHVILNPVFSISLMVFHMILKREQMHQNCYTVRTFPKLFVLVVFSFVHDWLCSDHCMRFYQKVPGLGQKRNAGLTYSILAVISFKIVYLGTYTAIRSFFPHFKSTMEVIFLNPFWLARL
jgi:hypothetical protein